MSAQKALGGSETKELLGGKEENNYSAVRGINDFYLLAPLIFDYFCPHCPAPSVSKRREFLPVLLSSSCHSVPCHKWGTKLKQKPHVTSKVHFQERNATCGGG